MSFKLIAADGVEHDLSAMVRDFKFTPTPRPGPLTIDQIHNLAVSFKQAERPSLADPRSAIHEDRKAATIAAQRERMAALRSRQTDRTEPTFADGKTADELIEWIETEPMLPDVLWEAASFTHLEDMMRQFDIRPEPWQRQILIEHIAARLVRPPDGGIFLGSMA